MLLLLFQIAWAWFHCGYERRNDDDRGNWLANFSFDYVHYSWKELKNEGYPRACWKSRENVLASAIKIQANFLLFTKIFHVQEMLVCYTAVFRVVTQCSSPQTAAAAHVLWNFLHMIGLFVRPQTQRERNVVRFSAAVCGEERCVTTLKTAV